MKQQILLLGNQELAGPAPTEQEPEPKPPEQPLMKIFIFLRGFPPQSKVRFVEADQVGLVLTGTLALNYQLEALFAQAAQLDRTAWGGNVRITVPNDRRSLTIDYWTRARPPVPPRGPRRPAQAAAPVPQGTLTIAIEASKTLATTSRILAVLSGSPSSDGQRLNVSWDRKGVRQSPAEAASLQFRPGKLDLEGLLSEVAAIETDATLRRAVESLRVSSDSMPGFPDAYLIPQDRKDSDDPTIRLGKLVRTKIRGDQSVEVGLDRHSGRFTMRLLGEATAQTQATIARATDTLNEHPEAMRDMLARVRSAVCLSRFLLCFSKLTVFGAADLDGRARAASVAPRPPIRPPPPHRPDPHPRPRSHHRLPPSSLHRPPRRASALPARFDLGARGAVFARRVKGAAGGTDQIAVPRLGASHQAGDSSD